MTMNRFIDPRTNPDPSADRPPARTTGDPEQLEELHRLCREGRLYDVERWIAEGRPLQPAEPPTGGARRKKTVLETALKQQNHALTLLLLCNGYDPNLEPRCALDTACDLRRADLAELLLDWGADPRRVDLGRLFDTYERPLFERFYHLGVDFTAGHALARALGYHSSNKPLFGFAKRYRETDPLIRRELDMALAQHASTGNERGALLCLWAGGDPHATVPALPYFEDSPPYEDDEEEVYTAVAAACGGGHAALLERFAPDPARDDFEALFLSARNAETVELLARQALPTDVTAVVRGLVESSGWYVEVSDAAGALRRLFELGVRWEEAPSKAVGEVRRSLLQARDHVFKELVQTLATADYCSAEIRRELARTPAFQKRLQAVDLMPKPGDRGWARRWGAEQAKAVLAAFELELPPPPKPRRHR